MSSRRQYWPARTSHRKWPSSTNLVSRSVSLFCSQARISSIFVRTNMARRRLNFGDIGGFSERKLVKPTKLLCSWAPHQCSFDHLFPTETKPGVGASDARILGEADSTVGKKLR